MAFLSKGSARCCMSFLVSTLKEITICLRARWSSVRIDCELVWAARRSRVGGPVPQTDSPMSTNHSEGPCYSNESAT